MSNIKTKITFLFTFLYFFSSTVAPALANATYSYDANGNMTSDGVNCYTYNDANQLSQVKNCSSNQIIAQYVYDYQGNRIVKKNYVNGTLNTTVYSPNKGYETKKLSDNSTQNTTYYYVNDELVAKKNPDGSKNYYHNDNLGSASVLTDQNGSVVENTQYYPFGDIRSGGTKSKYLYTGQENDPETGLDYYNARYYNSHLRHFTQPDSFTANMYDPQDLNEYSYVKNNPLTYTDPSGHFATLLSAPVILAAGVVVGGYEYAVNPLFRSSINKLGPIVAQGGMDNWQKFWGQVNNFFGWNNEKDQVLKGAQNPHVREAIHEGLRQHEAFYKQAEDAGMTANKAIFKQWGIYDRPDAVDFKSKTIYELKPTVTKVGQQQLDQYVNYANKYFSSGWKGVLKSYK